MMNEAIIPSSLHPIIPAPRHPIIPAPRHPIAIRTATMADLPFMDGLQKKHNKALGYFPTKQFAGYIEMGAVLIAEDRHEGTEARRHEGEEGSSESPCISLRASVPSCLRASPLGYIIAKDRYLKRDELGVVYQLCVVAGDQRKLVGASLIKAVFERAAYGCRLFCCWCAQDLEANYFWESLGFAPIAFRAGSTGKKRVHIFWQKRIDGEPEVSECGSSHSDTPSPRHSVTSVPAPYWYPFQTNAGAIREDRIVFPIPPGVHWKDVRAVAVPRAELTLIGPERKQEQPSVRKRVNGKERVVHVGVASTGGFWAPAPKPERKPREQKVKAPAAKIDPKYLAAARELRDRWMERANDQRLLSTEAGKYDVSRKIDAARERKPMPLLLAG